MVWLLLGTTFASEWGDVGRFEGDDAVTRIGIGPRIAPAPVVGGQVSGERSNLVALAGIDPAGFAQVFCTGSVIQDTWILTAAHCITGSRDIQAFGLELSVIWGTDIVSQGYTHAIPWAEAIAFPGYTDAVFANDIGVIELAEPVPPWVKKTVLNDAPLDDGWIGTELTFVGYGITRDGNNDAGVLRQATIPITDFDAQYIYAFDADSNVCQGDSGGPSFRSVDGYEAQVGVNAFVTPSCAGGSSGSSNVVEFLGFVRDHVPDALLEPEPEGIAGGAGFGLGVSDPFRAPGLAQRFEGRDGPGPGTGCATVGQGPWVLWGVVLALAFRRRGG